MAQFRIAIVMILLTCAGTIAWSRSYDPRLRLKDHLSNVSIISHHQDSGSLRLGVDGDRYPLTIDGLSLSDGLGVGVPSRTEIQLLRGSKNLEGKCGIPDRLHQADVICRIEQNGQELFRSAPLSASNRTEHFRVAISDQLPAKLEFLGAGGTVDGMEGAWIDVKSTR